jgi:hypothetical protein
MTFLNQALMWGGLAFSVPLIIHLLNRSRFRTIDWGAMHLLESVLKVNHRRLRLEQILLLLIRCAIPLALAACLARPVLTGSAALEGEAPVSMVVVVDNSYSMDTQDAQGTRLEQALTSAREIIDSTHQGSEISVLFPGSKPTRLLDRPAFDSATVTRNLAQQQGGMGAADYAATLSEAVEILGKMGHARKELIVISDFQPRDWESLGGVEATLQDAIASSEVPIHATFLPVGQVAEENISIESLDYARRVIGVGQLLNVRVNLRQWGRTDSGTQRVQLSIDGESIGQTQVNIPGDSTTQVLFPIRFEKAGSHVVEVEVLSDDSLPSDNILKASMDVWDVIEVVLVDGAPSSEPLKSETDFLSIALTPLTLGRLPLADLVQTESIELPALNAEILENTRVLVLANVNRLSDAQLADVKQFVQSGGALLVSVGDRVDLNWYNDALLKAGLLPRRLVSLQGASVDAQGDVQGGGTQVIPQNYEHPALVFFNDPQQGDLSTASIRRWYSTTESDEPAAAAAGESGSVMAWLGAGDPWLIEKKLGNGTVVLMTTACDADWSDFPLQPVYVPLVQQLVTTLAATATPPRNIETGQPAVAVLEPAAEDVAAIDQALVITPAGQQRTVPVQIQDERRQIRFDSTQQPGVYELTTPEGELLHFVARTTAEESDPRLMKEEQVKLKAESLGGQLIDSTKTYLAEDDLRRHGREIWKYLLAAMVGLLAIEIFLQQRFAGVQS